MAYCTVVDVKNFIPQTVVLQLSDDNDSDSIDEEKVNFAIQQADDLIDSYLRGRYTVPITGTVPSMIRDLSVRATVYFLFKRSLYSTMPDAIENDFKYIIRTLEGMQKGQINAFTSEPGFFDTNKVTGDRVFTNATTVLATQNAWSTYQI